MKKAYFIYSKREEENREERELLKGIEDWIPEAEIDIQEATINQNQLCTLDGKLIGDIPSVLRNKESPVYVTKKALSYLIEREDPQSFMQMRAEKELIIGKPALRDAIDTFRKYAFSP